MRVAKASFWSALPNCTAAVKNKAHRKSQGKKKKKKKVVFPTIWRGAAGRVTVTHLKELLDDVIPEHVGHQLVRRLQDFPEHHLPLGGGRPLQLLLDEPALGSKRKGIRK